jgi:hypothetical protein
MSIVSYAVNKMLAGESETAEKVLAGFAAPYRPGSRKQVVLKL